MRSYLDLIAIQARVNKKQSRMTRICIFLAVFLIMGLFGMADMQIRSEKMQAVYKYGSWHAAFKNVTDEQAAILAARPEVAVGARYDVRNYRLDEGWRIEGTQTVICGMDAEFLEMQPEAGLFEGVFPEGETDIACADSIQSRLGLHTGDMITVVSPEDEPLHFTVTGFFHATSMLTEKDAFGVFVNTESFRRYFSEGEQTKTDSVFYVQFVPFCRIQRAIRAICGQLGLSEEQVAQNAYLLGLLFQSTDTYLIRLYLVVFVLAALVATAGILMITGSLNSSVAQRTEFFGMMRCLGATPKQVAKFVRREALSWCKEAIPTAVLAGTFMLWGLCALLRFVSPGYFGSMPVFGISWIGIFCGAGIGILTVLLAARAPARRASSVSPLTAVSGNAGTVFAVRRATRTGRLPVEISLGIHHAKGSRKNFFLMSGSFAFSIILFLSFSVLRDFMGHALTPLQPYSPDITILSPDNTCSIPRDLVSQLEEDPEVKRVYGRSFAYELEAEWNGQTKRVTLISYEDHQLDWAKKELYSGTVEEIAEGVSVLAAYHGEDSLHTGDVLTFPTESGGVELPVSGVLTRTPFDEEPGIELIFCSESLFQELTGFQGYTVIDLQVKKSISDEKVLHMRELAGENVVFSDQRQKNMEVSGAYSAFLLFLYGFLAVILMISAFHIINSMSMSVSARMEQYRNLYAIGMSQRQILSMIAAEAGSYLACGILTGTLAGLWCNHFLYQHMVASRWGDAWRIPGFPLITVLTAVVCATFMSLIGPAKRIRKIDAV